MKYCPSCGAANKDDYRFCYACGNKLQPAPAQESHTRPTGQFQIKFQRPQIFSMSGNLFHVKIDGAARHELKNGGAVIVPMTAGLHTVEISVFGMPKKTQFSFMAVGDAVFTCKPNPSASLTLWAAPVKVTDHSGKEY